jgi:nucleoside-triphosphatase THEP1
MRPAAAPRSPAPDPPATVFARQARAWSRAAVYGSLWAASEIVAGSFLHNLRIPFAGSLLAAFGVLVMTAGHRANPERGLIWRAALICALMKSISPSAVILGPMIGIAMEGALLEACVRLSGGHAAGYVIGGALAVSWSMVQRILNALISFGPDVVRLYVEAYSFAARSLGVSRVGPFDLIATLVVAEWAIGFAAATIGLRVASRRAVAVASPAVLARGTSDARSSSSASPITATGPWSLTRLLLVCVGLVAGMAGLSFVPLWAGALYVAACAGLVLRAYPRAAARIQRPALWIELAVVMLLAGLLLGGVRSGAAGMLTGLAAGAAMVLRAMLVLFGFTAISVELRNPIILSWVERRRLRGLSDALGVAFGTLPAFMDALVRSRAGWRHPGRLATELLDVANTLAADGRARAGGHRTVIVTGDTGSGKTTLVGQTVERLRARDVPVAGILAPGFIKDGRRTGFDIVNLATGESTALAREQAGDAGLHARWSRFAFRPEGLDLGARALGPTAHSADVIVVDEVGPFELSGGGWAPALDRLSKDYRGTLVLAVRGSVVDAVRARWGSPDTVVCEVTGTSAEALAALIFQGRSASEPAVT